jgi:CubicO group peptidase (beta-lactamase class C family)
MKTLLLCLLLVIHWSNLFPQADSLNKKLQNIKTKYNVVGMSVAVVKGDSLVFNKGYGLKDISRNLQVNDSTVYRIASISKMITATALMQLYDLGLFGLDDDVSSYIGFSLRNPSFPNDPITFRKLLSHTSSLRDGSGYDSFLSATYNNSSIPHLQSLLTSGGTYYTTNMYSSTKAPSANYFTYANINYGVIGTLIEKIINQRFDIYCKDNIFTPLGMKASFNIQDIPNINNVAVLYRLQGGNWVAQADNFNGIKPPPRDLTQYVIGTNGLIFGPQGGLRVSSYDLAKFMIAHLNNGIFKGARILSDSSSQKMHNPTWIYNGSNGDNYYGIFNTYGLGCHRTVDILPTETMYGHPGEAYGLISDLYFSKLKDYGVIFITNGGQWGYGTYSGWYNIEEDVYKACLGELNNFVTSINEQKNEKMIFNLEQNYPNPFNPVTKIKFHVSIESKIIIKIIDVIGNEVATLVDDVKLPGYYETEFDGSKYKSGIYFCQMQIPNSKTELFKKMILLK